MGTYYNTHRFLYSFLQVDSLGSSSILIRKYLFYYYYVVQLESFNHALQQREEAFHSRDRPSLANPVPAHQPPDHLPTSHRPRLRPRSRTFLAQLGQERDSRNRFGRNARGKGQ